MENNKKIFISTNNSIYIYISFLYIIICWSYNLNSSVVNLLVFISSSLLLIRIYFLCKRKMSIESSLIALLSISMPISFRNIFGGSYSDIPIPWFFLILLIFIVRGFIQLLKNEGKLSILPFFILWLAVFSFIPIIISLDKVEGVKEYLSYLTFLLGLFSAIIYKNTINRLDYEKIVNFYIFGILFSSIGIIIQYISYTYFFEVLFRTEFYGGGRIYYGFILGDMSGMTVYMATGILFLLLSKRKFKFLLSSIIILGVVFSSARSGFISLVIVLILYLFFARTNKQKLTIFLFLLIGASFGGYLLTQTRANINGISNFITQDSGRIGALITTFEKFKESPIIGYGYDFGLQLKASGSVVPHFALVNLLGQTGIIITFGFLILIYKIFIVVKRKGATELLFVIILSLIGSCISPGFFDLRFFTILSLISILYIPDRENYEFKYKGS